MSEDQTTNDTLQGAAGDPGNGTDAAGTNPNPATPAMVVTSGVDQSVAAQNAAAAGSTDEGLATGAGSVGVTEADRLAAVQGAATNEPSLPAAEIGSEEKLMAHIRGYLRAAHIRFDKGVIEASDATANMLVSLQTSLVHMSKHTQTILHVLEEQAAQKESA